jgi:hypothetical protein
MARARIGGLADRPRSVRANQAVLESDDFGGCRLRLLAQWSRFSMTISWLGRRGFGAFGSSDSFRGSLISSVMAMLRAGSMRPSPAELIRNILFSFNNFAYLATVARLREPAPTYKVEQTTQSAKFGMFAMKEMRDERLQVMLSPEELAALDDFRFKHRMPTRAAAVRELLKLGLTVMTTDGNTRMKSSNYGVFSRGPESHKQNGGNPED